MVLTLDGNTEIGVHVWSEIGEIVNTNVCNVLPSNISAMLTQGGGLILYTLYKYTYWFHRSIHNHIHRTIISRPIAIKKPWESVRCDFSRPMRGRVL